MATRTFKIRKRSFEVRDLDLADDDDFEMANEILAVASLKGGDGEAMTNRIIEIIGELTGLDENSINSLILYMVELYKKIVEDINEKLGKNLKKK